MVTPRACGQAELRLGVFLLAPGTLHWRASRGGHRSAFWLPTVAGKRPQASDKGQQGVDSPDASESPSGIGFLTFERLAPLCRRPRRHFSEKSSGPVTGTP